MTGGTMATATTGPYFTVPMFFNTDVHALPKAASSDAIIAALVAEGGWGNSNKMQVDFDQTAPQVYIEAPSNGVPWTGDIDVRGAVLPGWSAAVEAIAIPVDKQRRFAAKVGAPGGNALAIRLSHPQHGVHYYLRRPK